MHSDSLLSFLALISSAYIPFAIFLMEGGDKTEPERNVFKVERAVIMKYVLHLPYLITSLFFGGVSALIYDDKSGLLSIRNIIPILIYIVSVGTLMWIILEIVQWLGTSAKADDVGSKRFTKWKKYLSNIDDKDFNSTWEKIFGNPKTPEILQPAYISIFLEKVASFKHGDKYASYRILRNNLENINLDRPDILEVIIGSIDIDSAGITLLESICDEITAKHETDLFFHFLDKKISTQEDADIIKNALDRLVFKKLDQYFDNPDRLTNLLSGIPKEWTIHELLSADARTISYIMIDEYVSWITKMINRQEKNVDIAIGRINSINERLIGDYVDEDLDKKMLVDFCEIYGNWRGAFIPTETGEFEDVLIDHYLGLGARYFASSNCYTAYGEINGKPDFEPSIKRKEAGTYRLLGIIFPQYINDRKHLSRMKKKIRNRLKDNPNEYRLKKLKELYERLDKTRRIEDKKK